MFQSAFLLLWPSAHRGQGGYHPKEHHSLSFAQDRHHALPSRLSTLRRSVCRQTVTSMCTAWAGLPEPERAAAGCWCSRRPSRASSGRCVFQPCPACIHAGSCETARCETTLTFDLPNFVLVVHKSTTHVVRSDPVYAYTRISRSFFVDY